MKLEINAAPSFSSSPFPTKLRAPEEVLKDGTVIPLPQGTTIPDYIRRVYKVQKIIPVTAPYQFLNRDMDNKQYTPEDTDRFVFKNKASISLFKKETIALIGALTDMWKGYGLPILKDKDRNIEIPDTDAVIRELRNPKHPFSVIYDANRSELGTIVSNVDILKKASIQRTVLPGWWVVSYDGRNAINRSYFDGAIAVLVDAMNHLKQSLAYKESLTDVLQAQGDPLDTAVGFPLYAAELDAKGNPISKLKVLDQYNGIGNVGPDWVALKKEISRRGRTPFERDHVFAIAPIRRIMPGYKWAHVFKPSMSGLRLDHDTRGHSTNRVAWMAPYLLNLIISPIQTEWKALRKIIPGLYHDGETRTAVLKGLRDQKPLLLESDFSNYDRTIPNDVMADFMKSYCASLPNSDYWLAILLQTQRDLPIVWGDHISSGRGHGWVFQVESLALLSGLKITSEVGTYMNLLINIAGWLNTGYMTKAEVFSYLTLASRDPNWKQTFATNPPLVLIQSDDTQLIHSRRDDLFKLYDAFKAGSDAAGIEAKIELGDKFLMRHMTAGIDQPVLARIYQNTLSNEEPPEDAIKFLVGLAVRTDGVGGWKTFDPFFTGTNVGMTKVDRDIGILVFTSLLGFTSTSASVIHEATEFISLIISGLEGSVERNGRFYVTELVGRALDGKRDKYLRALASQEAKLFLNRASADTTLTRAEAMTLLNQLRKNQQSPSAMLTLEYLKHHVAELEKVEKMMVEKENRFYRFAMKKLGLSITIEGN